MLPLTLALFLIIVHLLFIDLYNNIKTPVRLEVTQRVKHVPYISGPLFYSWLDMVHIGSKK